MASFQRNKITANKDLHKDEQHKKATLEFFTLPFLEVDMSHAVVSGWGWKRCTVNYLFNCSVCVRMPLFCLRGTPRPSAITNVCLSANLPHLRTLTLKWGQIVSWMSLLCVLQHIMLYFVCVSVRAYVWLRVPVCVGEVTIRAWVVTTACCPIGRLEELFTLYLCAQWRRTDPLQTAASTPDSHEIQAPTHTIIPRTVAGLVTMQTSLLPHFGRLTSPTVSK